jgi:hypothetical protein
MNKMILDTLKRDILFISILMGLMLIIILSYVITHNMSSLDMKVPQMINSTRGAKATGINPIAQSVDSALESENIGRIVSVPNKCLGSALCPD